MRPVRFLALAIGLALLLAVPMGAQSSRPAVAVLSFDFGSIEHWWSGNQDIGKGIADLLVDELLEEGSFRLFDRTKLDVVLAEQNFNNSDRVDPEAKAAKIGKAAGVKYLIFGTVTKFGTENSNRSVGGGGIGGKFGLGKVGTASGKATVQVTAKIIDTSTTEILVSARGEGTSKRSGLLLAGAGGGAKGAAVGALNFGSSDFKDTIIGEATAVAVKDLATKLVAKKDRLK